MRLHKLHRAVVLLCLSTVVFLIACGGGKEATPTARAAPAATTAAPAPTPTRAPAAAPTTGPAVPTGKLTVAQPKVGAGNEWVWSRLTEVAVRLYWQTVFETMFAVTPDGSIENRLSTKWELIDNNTAWKFTIRKGIPFHEGWGELNAEDVSFSWQQAVREESRYSRKAIAANIAKVIEIPDPYTIIFRPGVPRFDTLTMFTVPQASANVVSTSSKKYFEAVGEDAASRKPIGTGAWKFEEQKPNESLRVSAVKGHWRKTPAFAELVYLEVPEEATRNALLKTGGADIIEASLESAKQLTKDGFRVVRSVDAVFTYVALGGQYHGKGREGYSPSLPWVGDHSNPESMERAKLVRQAMSVAINREEIARSLFAGWGRPLNAWGPWLGPLKNAARSSWVRPFDPGKARELLRQAGYPQGFKIKVLLHDNSPGQPAGRLATEAVATLYWPAIGLDVSIQNILAAQVFPDYIGRKSNWAGSFTNSTYNDPLEFWSVVTTTDATFNLGAEYQTLDDLVATGVQTMDLNTRKEIWLKVGDFLFENEPYIPVVAVDVAWPVSSRIGEWPLMGFGTFYLNNLEYITHAK